MEKIIKGKFSSDKNTQLIISLLKAHGIRKIIASPGTTVMSIIGSVQNDDFFEVYSSIDERSAAYMACGLSEESKEPVALLCTEATASRNYVPALTEAYYRKIPILVIAGIHCSKVIGHLHSQVIDRTKNINDTIRCNVTLDDIYNWEDAWSNMLNANKAILELFHRGGGPSLINVSTNPIFDTDTICEANVIHRYTNNDILPTLNSSKIAIFVGSHHKMTINLQNAIEKFCATNNAIVICDHTSGYMGKYKVQMSLVTSQQFYRSELLSPELVIHIGEVSGDNYTTYNLSPKNVWRVSEDGELRDTFFALRAVFEMDEESFFCHYTTGEETKCDYYEKFIKEYSYIYDHIPELNFGNLWIAKYLSKRLPTNSVIHLSIFNTLRSWNFFYIDNVNEVRCNVGGFGIDGAISTCIGASFANPDKIHYLVVGDLAFLYDLNSLGNRHVKSNLRVLLINNGRGIEFRKKDHPGYLFGDDADKYIAAGGHFNNSSNDFVMHYAQSLGFEYICASNKDEFISHIEMFTQKEISDKPIIFEVFPTVESEVENLDVMRTIIKEQERKKYKSFLTNSKNKMKRKIIDFIEKL